MVGARHRLEIQVSIAIEIVSDGMLWYLANMTSIKTHSVLRKHIMNKKFKGNSKGYPSLNKKFLNLPRLRIILLQNLSKTKMHLNKKGSRT